MSILEKLGYDEGRIINVTLSEDKKTVELEEACDEFFYVDLNKDDFAKFIDELKAIHSQMVDGGEGIDN